MVNILGLQANGSMSHLLSADTELAINGMLNE